MAGRQSSKQFWPATADLDSALKSMSNMMACLGSCTWIRSKESKASAKRGCRLESVQMCACVLSLN